MPDREKVIRGLEVCLSPIDKRACKDCPYDGVDGCWQLKHDALELLKAQEPVRPAIGGNQSVDGCWWYICPNCQMAIDTKDLYCRYCGKAVKWDADD